MEKNPAAVALGKMGGKALRAMMTPEERTASARRAAKARWAKAKERNAIHGKTAASPVIAGTQGARATA